MRLPRDSHARRPKQFVAEPIAALNLVGYRARGVVVTLHRSNGFVNCGIKRLTHCFDGRYLVRVKQVQQPSVDRFHAFRDGRRRG